MKEQQLDQLTSMRLKMKFMKLIFSCMMLLGALQGLNASTGNQQLNWLTNYEEAVNQSKATSKPIILFFTGSDWCGWCNRLEEEAFDTVAFQESAGDKFIFLKLDYPLYKSLDARTTAQNKQLQKKYDIRSYPTLVILDSDQQPIGTTGYKPGGGKTYASHVLKMVNDYTAYKQQMRSVDKDKQKFSGADLKKLYEKSKELNLGNDTNKIIKAGMTSDYAHYFQVERYRALAEEGLIHDKEAITLRHKILAEDPTNAEHTHYDVAVIDFEAYSEQLNRDNYTPHLAVAPLVDYIKKFGNQDNENTWRLEMIISQVYLDKNRLEDALEHAQSSHENAPLKVQPDIATAIKNIESKLATTASR